MTNSFSLSRILILVIAGFAAIYMGTLLATSQLEALVWIVLSVVLILCMWMGRDIWLLIPATMYLNFIFPWLPGGFPPSKIAILLVITWSLQLIALRRLRLCFKFTHIEFAALVLLATILQGYVRNPVGLAAFGSDSVGAKPYAIVMISTLGGLYLASLKVKPDRIRRMMWVIMASSAFSTTINLLAYLSSAVASVTGPIFGAFGKGNPFINNGLELTVIDETDANRIPSAGELANFLARWITSMRNPLLALFSPLWGALILVTLISSVMSGYRNGIMSIGLTLAFGTFYWGKARSVIAVLFIALIAYTLASLINPIAPLPPNIQRSLTFLPGTWEQKYKDDAKHSTEWRTEMWTLVLTTDRYIKNKIFGDGLGISQTEYRFLSSLGKETKGLSEEMSQERALATQSYHSGPVQTVRISGYVGLAVLLYVMIVVAVRAHRLIMRSRGTEWFGPVIFLVLHMVWHPLFFVFVFGAFGDDVPAILMNMGILRLIENNLPLPQRQAYSTPLARHRPFPSKIARSPAG